MIRHIHPFALFIVFSAILLGFGLAIASRAIGDPSIEPNVTKYANTNSAAVCATLDQYPTITGVAELIGAVIKDGFTTYQAGEIIALAVENRCPKYVPLLEEFSAAYTQRTTI